MYQALYRKYRPTSFDDVCGQEHITSVLKMQLQKGRTSHAYIFCGSRGTGKTTCAKILAKAVNCENLQNGEPCNACPSCLAINEERVLDVVEMDAASNNGVDHIRRLCDEVQFLPSEAKKRVYIIDEVHMLSISAFNALLKTIEEPPEHVLFILATTEMNDIPATIMSRCQRFDFKRITPNVIAKRLLSVAEKEKISLKEDAAQLIARLSDGAMRDALSLLEAFQSHQGDITVQDVHSVLGLGSRSSILSLCKSISEQDVTSCLNLVQEIYERISDFKEVIGELIAVYRDLLVIRSVPQYREYLECYESDIPVLEEIAKKLSLETILYQTKALENFYVSYDRIATEKKASAEILMIRLCKEELSEEMEALISRISKLERVIETGSVPTTRSSPSKKETSIHQESERVVPVSKANEISRQEADHSFHGVVKLKNILQREAFLKPWLEQLEFEKRDSALIIKTGTFVKGILMSSNVQEIFLNAGKEVDPSILSVLIEDKSTSSSAVSQTGLEDL